MKIVQKKYLRTYIALSSMAASLLVGNKVAFAEEDAAAAASAPIESTNPTLPLQSVEESPDEASSAEETVMPVETILDAGVYGADQLAGTTQPNVYVVVCAGESKVGEQSVDDTGIFTVTLANIPEGTTVLRVKVDKDASQTFLLNETDWQVPVEEVTEALPVVDAENPQAIPTEPSLPVTEDENVLPVEEEPQPEPVTENSGAEPSGDTSPEATDAEETVPAPMLTATTNTTTPVVEEAKGTWYYYVQSGDTLLKIAGSLQHGCRQLDALEQFDKQPHQYRAAAERQRHEYLCGDRQGDADVRHDGRIRELSRAVCYRNR